MYLDPKLIAKELKSLRTKNLGVHFNTLSKYEKDATDMKLSLFGKLLKYYGIDELIFFKVIREYNHKEIEE